MIKIIKALHAYLTSRNLKNKRIIKFVNYLNKLIVDRQEKYYTTYIEGKVNALPYMRNEMDKLVITTIAENAYRTHLNMIKLGSIYTNDFLTAERLINISIKVMYHIVHEVGVFSGIQPMSAPVSLAYSLKYIMTTPNTDSGDTTNRVSLDVVTQAVEAKMRKLTAKINFAQSLSTNYLNLTNELECILAREIATDILHGLFSLVSERANKSSITITNDADGYKKLFVGITRATVRIADSTRRGMGNVIITSPEIINTLKECGYLELVHSTENIDSSEFLYVGMLGNAAVYCNMHMKDEVLVTYKGSNVDTGFIYLPYSVVQNGGVVVDAESFIPSQRFMTRYGSIFNESRDGSNYYELIKVTVAED